jgi:hypothetical protein
LNIHDKLLSTFPGKGVRGAFKKFAKRKIKNNFFVQRGNFSKEEYTFQHKQTAKNLCKLKIPAPIT